MGTEQRYDIYDLFLQFPEPLVPRNRRLEVAERIDRDGAVVTALDESAGARRARGSSSPTASRRSRCASCTPTAIPRTSRPSAAIVRGEFPKLQVSLSHEVVAELWEYQRCVTTCANAYVQPLMDTLPRAPRSASSPRAASPARCA